MIFKLQDLVTDFFVAIIMVFLVVGISGGGSAMANETNLISNGQVSAEILSRLAGKRFFFGHQGERTKSSYNIKMLQTRPLSLRTWIRKLRMPSSQKQRSCGRSMALFFEKYMKTSIFD